MQHLSRTLPRNAAAARSVAEDGIVCEFVICRYGPTPGLDALISSQDFPRDDGGHGVRRLDSRSDLGAARNAAALAAGGPVVINLDADNVLGPASLRHAAAFFSRQGPHSMLTGQLGERTGVVRVITDRQSGIPAC